MIRISKGYKISSRIWMPTYAISHETQNLVIWTRFTNKRRTSTSWFSASTIGSKALNVLGNSSGMKRITCSKDQIDLLEDNFVAILTQSRLTNLFWILTSHSACNPKMMATSILLTKTLLSLTNNHQMLVVGLHQENLSMDQGQT